MILVDGRRSVPRALLSGLLLILALAATPARADSTDLSRAAPTVALLECLAELGINSLMVEGGARIITSFLRDRLADLLVLTISPMLVGGLHAVDNLGECAWKNTRS